MKVSVITIEANKDELSACRPLADALISALNRAFNAVSVPEDLTEEEEDDDDE